MILSTEKIVNAIHSRTVIEFNYKGQKRIVEPFLIGIHKKTGKLELRAYQVGGYSDTKSLPPWRLYIVSEMSDIKFTHIKALSFRPFYNPNDNDFSKVVCAV